MSQEVEHELRARIEHLEKEIKEWELGGHFNCRLCSLSFQSLQKCKNHIYSAVSYTDKFSKIIKFPEIYIKYSALETYLS